MFPFVDVIMKTMLDNLGGTKVPVVNLTVNLAKASFIFATCLRSRAALTHEIYERDIIQVTSVLIILKKKMENNRTEKIV